MNKFSQFICTIMVTLLLSLSFSTLIVNAEDVLTTAATNQTTVASGTTTNGPAYDDDEMK